MNKIIKFFIFCYKILIFESFNNFLGMYTQPETKPEPENPKNFSKPQPEK
jgi:hypothetical protein